MKTLLRTLFWGVVVFRTWSPLGWGDVSVKIQIVFSEFYSDFKKVKDVLDGGIKVLKSEEWFLLSVKDKTDLGELYLNSGVLYKDERVFFLGEFGNFPSEEYKRAYCSILAHIFLLFMRCGYPVAILEQEDISKGLIGFFDDDKPESVILNIDTCMQEMFTIANQILLEDEKLKTLELENLGADLVKLEIGSGSFEKISFENCKLSEDIIDRLLNCKKLRALRLVKCEFPVIPLIEYFKKYAKLEFLEARLAPTPLGDPLSPSHRNTSNDSTEGREPPLKKQRLQPSIETIEVTESSVDRASIKQLYLLGTLCGVDIVGHESYEPPRKKRRVENSEGLQPTLSSPSDICEGLGKNSEVPQSTPGTHPGIKPSEDPSSPSHRDTSDDSSEGRESSLEEQSPENSEIPQITLSSPSDTCEGLGKNSEVPQSTPGAHLGIKPSGDPLSPTPLDTFVPQTPNSVPQTPNPTTPSELPIIPLPQSEV